MPEVYKRAHGDLRPPREALPGHAGRRVHHPKASSTCCRPAAASARPGRGAHRRRDGEGGADRREDGDHCASSPRSSISSCTRRSVRSARANAKSSPPASPHPGRRGRPSRLHRRRAEELDGAGRDVILVRAETSPEDIGGMDAARESSPARRQDLARRRRRPRHGQVLRRRRRRDPRSTREDDRRAGRRHVSRKATGSPSTAAPARCSWASSSSRSRGLAATSPAHGVGRQVPRAQSAHQRRHAPRRRGRPAASAPKGSACAARSTCSSARGASRPCAR